DDRARALAGEEHDRVGARPCAEVGGERRPRRALLVLGEAEGDLAGVAEGRAVDLARPAAADVPHHELERPADGQVGAVSLGEDGLVLVLEAGELHAAGAEARAREAHEQLGLAVGIDRQRPAAGPPGGEVGAEPTDAGQRLPFAALPADRAPDDLAVADAEQRRHRLDRVMPGVLELAIVDDARAARERRIVLREDGELCLAGQAREHGRNQLAGRAFSLDERDEARRERRSGWHDDPSSIYAADEALVNMMRRRRAPTLSRCGAYGHCTGCDLSRSVRLALVTLERGAC